MVDAAAASIVTMLSQVRPDPNHSHCLAGILSVGSGRSDVGVEHFGVEPAQLCDVLRDPGDVIDAIEQHGSPLRGGFATIMPSLLRVRRPRLWSAAPLWHDAIGAAPETVSGCRPSAMARTSVWHPIATTTRPAVYPTAPHQPDPVPRPSHERPGTSGTRRRKHGPAPQSGPLPSSATAGIGTARRSRL